MTAADALPFKKEYAGLKRKAGCEREKKSLQWLKDQALHVDTTGNGTATEAWLETFHIDDSDKYDFRLRDYGIWVEVSGTSFAKSQSAERFAGLFPYDGQPRLPVGTWKVEYAKRRGMVDSLVFMQWIDKESEPRFLPCSEIVRLAEEGKAIAGFFRKGERDYWLLQWDLWWDGEEFLKWLEGKP